MISEFCKLCRKEFKTRGGLVKERQRRLFTDLERWITKGIDNDWEFLGFHTIQFENTCFDDGKVFFDGLELSEIDVKNLLSFDFKKYE